MHTSGLFANNSIYGIEPASYAKSKRPARSSSSSSFDTISISEEAKNAYAQYKNSIANAESKQTSSVNLNQKNTAIEDKLTNFFNNTHSSTNAVISGDVVIDAGVGELLPENKILKDQIEAEIDRIGKEENGSPFVPASEEYIRQTSPLRQKLNAIAALGDSMVLTDDVLEKSASFLQKLEDSWSKSKGYDASLEGQFRSAVRGTGDTPANRMSEEERERKLNEELMKKMAANQKS